MNNLITFSNAIKQTGMARSTIAKRLRKLEQKPVKMKTPGVGQPCNALTPEQLKMVIELTPSKARELMVDKKMAKIKATPKKASRHILSSSTGIAKNRENSYYMTIQPYEMMNGFNAIGRIR